jgi:glycerol transport system permease protein
MRTRFPLVAIAYVTLLMAPVLWLLSISVKSGRELFGGLTILPRDPTLANFAFILSDRDWSMGYVHATIYAALNAALSLAVALPAAYAFSRYRFRGARSLLFGFLAFRMMAPAILLVPFVEIFSRLGLIDSYLAVALAHCFFNVPIAIWTLEGYISAVPAELDDTARLDGHSLQSYFVRILVPQIAPGLAVTAFFCFMFSWTEFLLANALTVIDIKPIGSIMTRAASVLAANIPLISAASILGMVPGVILIVFMRNHLARGFSMGRVH